MVNLSSLFFATGIRQMRSRYRWENAPQRFVEPFLRCSNPWIETVRLDLKTFPIKAWIIWLEGIKVITSELSADMQWFEETEFFLDWSPCFGTIQIKGTKRWVFFDDQAKKLFSKSMVFNLNMAIKPLPLTGTHILNPMAVFTLNDLMKLICDTDSTKQAPRKGRKSIKLPQ